MRILVTNAVEDARELVEHGFLDVTLYATNLNNREDDSSAGRLLEKVEHAFAQSPTMHEQGFVSECIGGEPKPQDMGVYTGQLMPNDTKIFGAFRYFNAHKALDRLSVAHRMPERANAAYSLSNVDELVIIFRLDQSLETAVHEPNLRHRFQHDLVLDDEVEVQGLRQDRMLRTERDN